MSSNRHMCTASTLSQAFSSLVYTSGDENIKSRKDVQQAEYLLYCDTPLGGLLFFLKISKEHL